MLVYVFVGGRGGDSHLYSRQILNTAALRTGALRTVENSVFISVRALARGPAILPVESLVARLPESE